MDENWDEWNAKASAANNSNNQTSLMDLDEQELDKMLKELDDEEPLNFKPTGRRSEWEEMKQDRKKAIEEEARLGREKFAKEHPELVREPTAEESRLRDIIEQLKNKTEDVLKEVEQNRRRIEELKNERAELKEEVRKAAKTEGRRSPRSSPPRSPPAHEEYEDDQEDPEIEDMLYVRKRATTVCPVKTHTADVLTAVKISAEDNPYGYCPRHWNMWKNKLLRADESEKKKAENEMQRAQREQERHLKFVQTKRTELPKYKSKIVQIKKEAKESATEIDKTINDFKSIYDCEDLS